MLLMILSFLPSGCSKKFTDSFSKVDIAVGKSTFSGETCMTVLSSVLSIGFSAAIPTSCS